jgi:hypothetical protein
MSDLIKLAESLKHTDATLKLLIEVSDQSLPKIAQDVRNITEGVKNGFNTELLKYQVRKTLDESLSESNIAVIKMNADQTAQTLATAVQKAANAAKEYKESSNFHNLVLTFLIALIIGLLAGSLLMWSSQYSKIEQLQADNKACYRGLSYLSAFLNTSCSIKKAYGVYSGHPVHDCSKRVTDF